MNLLLVSGQVVVVIIPAPRAHVASIAAKPPNWLGAPFTSINCTRTSIRLNGMDTKLRNIRSECARAIAMVSFSAIWPFLHILNIYRDEPFSVLRLGLYGLGTLLAACAGFLLFHKIFAKILSWCRAGSIYSVSVISFFCYSMTYSLAHELWQGYYLKSWATFAIVMFLLGCYLSRSSHFQNLVLVFGVVVFSFPTVQYLSYRVQQSVAGEESIGMQFKIISDRHSDNLPSVYHIALDEYARADVLKKLYNFDNSDFLKNLQSVDST